MMSLTGFFCVPSMALILLVQVQSRVFTAKCSEPQVGISNGMDGGSGVPKRRTASGTIIGAIITATAR